METKAIDVVRALAAIDPVKWGEGLSKRRMCYLCGRESAENEENVTHLTACPWIQARLYVGHKHLNADTGVVG